MVVVERKNGTKRMIVIVLCVFPLYQHVFSHTQNLVNQTQSESGGNF